MLSIVVSGNGLASVLLLQQNKLWNAVENNSTCKNAAGNNIKSLRSLIVLDSIRSAGSKWIVSHSFSFKQFYSVHMIHIWLYSEQCRIAVYF